MLSEHRLHCYSVQTKLNFFGGRRLPSADFNINKVKDGKWSDQNLLNFFKFNQVITFCYPFGHMNLHTQQNRLAY